MQIHKADTTGTRLPAAARLTVLAVALAAAILIAGPALAGKDEPPEASHDGLRLAPDTEAALVYVKPGADFSGYDRVMILDAYVAFKKNWARDHNVARIHKVTSRDIEEIKQETAKLFREVFVEELDAKGGYTVAGAPDTDVLLLRPAIIDLDVTAPDVDTPGRSRTFTSTAGAATLYLELYDSVSSEILARVVDRKAATGHFMRWSNKLTNRVEAERILEGWAGLLRARLDEFHGKE